MKSFHLDLGAGRRLSKTGVLLLAATAATMIVIAVPLMRQVGHWTELLFGLIVVANGAAIFFGGGWFSKRIGFPVITESRRTRDPQCCCDRCRVLTANKESDWRRAIELCDEILDTLSEVEGALGLPSIQITDGQGGFYLRCRNIGQAHYPESVRQTIMYDKDDWNSEYLGPFKKRPEAEGIKKQIWDSLNGDTD